MPRDRWITVSSSSSPPESPSHQSSRAWVTACREGSHRIGATTIEPCVSIRRKSTSVPLALAGRRKVGFRVARVRSEKGMWRPLRWMSQCPSALRR